MLTFSDLINIKEYWYNYFIISSILYLPTILVVKYLSNRFIKNSLSDSLKIPWAIWCSILSIFSCFGSYYIGLYILKNNFQINIFEEDAGNWYIYFIISKIFELLDTFFIILRNKPLILLHYYHHLCTLIIAFHSMNYFCNEFSIYIGMNYFVHTFMYSYYSIYCFYPKISAYGKYITMLQILQMVLGLVFIIYNFFNDELHCQYINYKINIANTYYYSTIMYLTYLLLFIKVYYEREKRHRF